MNLKRNQLTFTLKKMIEATENKEIQTSEEFLSQLINELHKRKIINFEEAINK